MSEKPSRVSTPLPTTLPRIEVPTLGFATSEPVQPSPSPRPSRRVSTSGTARINSPTDPLQFASVPEYYIWNGQGFKTLEEVLGASSHDLDIKPDIANWVVKVAAVIAQQHTAITYNQLG